MVFLAVFSGHTTPPCNSRPLVGGVASQVMRSGFRLHGFRARRSRSGFLVALCRSSRSRQPSAAAAAATTPWLQLRHPPSAHVGPNPPSWMQAAWAFAIAWAPPAPRHCGPAAPSGLWTAAHAPHRAGAEPLAKVRSSCAGANTTNKHTRTYTEVLCIQGFDLSPSHAVSTQFGVEMKLLTRASERFWVRDPPMWTRISRFNSCQQQRRCM